MWTLNWNMSKRISLCHVRINRNLFRVRVGVTVSVGVRVIVGDPVLVVWQRFFLISRSTTYILTKPNLLTQGLSNKVVSTTFLYFPVSITHMSTKNFIIIINTTINTTIKKEYFGDLGKYSKQHFSQIFLGIPGLGMVVIHLVLP